MGRRPNDPVQPEPVSAAMRRHLQALGLRFAQQYFNWCWDRGFAASLEKSKADLQEELDAHEADAARRRQQVRLHKNVDGFLEAVCQGDLSPDEIDRPDFKRVATEIAEIREAAASRVSLLETLRVLARRKDLLFGVLPGPGEPPFVRGIIRMHERRTLWLRPLEEWQPKSKNTERQFGELTHHLFDRFGDVPRFMERVWLRSDRPSWRYRDWYVHLGRGHNLRTAKVPVTVTKRIAHAFGQAPATPTVEQAMRWAQMTAMGASKGAIEAVLATRIARSFEHETFWVTVLRFLAETPMLDPRQIGPIVDYIHAQRFAPVDVEVAPGDWRQEPPPQPGFSMRGRNAETLLRQVETWHRTLGQFHGLPEGEYDAAPFPGFSAQEKAGDGGVVQWTIRQLRSARALYQESEDLSHCVSSYHASCAKGHCTIWSLARSEDGDRYERRQTIEVTSDGVIVQCRGLANRDPTKQEWAIVNRWAGQENLTVAAFL